MYPRRSIAPCDPASPGGAGAEPAAGTSPARLRRALAAVAVLVAPVAMLPVLLAPGAADAAPLYLTEEQDEAGRETRQRQLADAWEAHPRQPLPPAPEQWLDDGVEVRNLERDRARELFFDGQWAELEERAAELRESGEEFPDGMSKLRIFFSGLTPHNWEGPVVEPDRLADFSRQAALWREQRPGSITQLTNSLLVDRALLESGGDPDAGRRFRDALLAAMNHEDACPAWYPTAVWFAGRERDQTAVIRWFVQGRQQWPTYSLLYTETARALLNRFGWTTEQVEVLASAFIDDPETRDQGIYASMLFTSGFMDERFVRGEVLWPRFRADLVRAVHARPQSVRRWNFVAKFACMARDREDAAAAFLALGPNTPLGSWKGIEGLAEMWRAWALAGADDPTRPAADALARTLDLRAGAPEALQFHPDPGQSLLVVGTRRRQLLFYRLPDGELVTSIDLTDRSEPFAGAIRVLRWSDDGSRLAVGFGPAGGVAVGRAGGLLLLDWDAAEAGVRVREELEVAHGVSRLAFVDGDSRLLISPTMATGDDRSNPPVLLDLGSHTWQYSGRAEVRRHNGLTFSASGRDGWLVFGNYEPFLMRLPAGAPDLLPPPAGQGRAVPPITRGYVGWHADLSPDGRLLAIGYGKSAGVERTLYGMVRVHRVPGMEQAFDLEPPYPYGNLQSVGISSDSAWLAAATRDGGAHLWCLETGECLRSWIAEPFFRNTQIHISPDRRWVATSSDNRPLHQVRIWDTEALGLAPEEKEEEEF